MTTAGPRRQERGERRIESILDAASGVFASSGYDAATMNGIAAMAGISPGSLYQFFASKQAIADALVERYVRDMQSMHARAFSLDGADAAPLERIGRIIDVIVEFQLANPGANGLMASARVSAEVAASTMALQNAMCDRVEPLVAEIAPRLAEQQRARSAEVCVEIVKALMPKLLAAPGGERRALIGELKRVLTAYLTALE